MATPLTRGIDFSQVYEPAEDSFLLLDCLEAESQYLKETFLNGEKAGLPLVLEIGCGSGIVTTFVHQSVLPKGLYLTGDVNLAACNASLVTSNLNGGTKYLDTIRGSLASYLRANAVDLLIFNPPYVPTERVPEFPAEDANDELRPSDQWLDLALDGGKDGMEVTNDILDNLDAILSPSGIAYILFCLRNQPEVIAKRMAQKGYKVVKVIERTAGYEVLSVYRFSIEH